MRASTLFPPLLAPAVLLAAACAEGNDPTGPGDLEPTVPELAAPELASPEPSAATLASPAYWADGYLYADASTQPQPGASFNRSGGAMTVARVAGTTGRYVIRFRGLSAIIGNRNTVRVTASSPDPIYCKPVGAFLVRDSVEVRCYRMGTGAGVNGSFHVHVLGKRDDRAFAFGNQPAAASYTAPSNGTWNPAGATRIERDGPGQYRVVFSGLGARTAAYALGHVQVNGVGTDKKYCKVQTWSGSPDLTVSVGCHTPAGVPADAKFAILFTQAVSHVGYAWGDAATAARYTPYSPFASNPTGGAITIYRYQVGQYTIEWTGLDPELSGYGSPQVTAWGEGDAQCNVYTRDTYSVVVRCYAANGVPMDSQYTVLLGS